MSLQNTSIYKFSEFYIDRITYDSSSSILILQFYSQCQQLLGKDRRKVAAEQGEGLLRHLLCHDQTWVGENGPELAADMILLDYELAIEQAASEVWPNILIHPMTY